MGKIEVLKNYLVLDKTDKAQKKLLKAIKVNSNNYNDLAISYRGDIGFEIVDEAIINDLLDRNARLARVNLEKRFQLSTSADKV